MSVDDRDLSKFLGSASLVVVGTLVGSSAKLVERAVVGRLLSESEYGEFTIAISILMLAGMLGAAGFAQGVPRFMARFDDERDIRGVIITGILVTVALSSVIVVALFNSWGAVSILFDNQNSEYLFKLFVLAVPLSVVFRIGIGGIRGLENTKFKIITQDLGYPILRVVLIAIFLGFGFSVVATGYAYIISLLIFTFPVYYLLNRLLPLIGDFQLHTREMAIFSAPLVISTFMSQLLTYTDTLMLGYFRTSYEVGIYSAAFPLAVSMSLILTAFGYLYLPLTSRYDLEKGKSVGRVYEITTKWLFLSVFPIFLTLIAFPSEIISLVFGSRYSAGGVALTILAFGFFSNAAAGRNRETLSALGATNYILIANTIAFVVNIGLNYLLIPLLGIRGAAVASACSYVGLNVVVFLLLLIEFNISPITPASIRSFFGLSIFVAPLVLIARLYIPNNYISIILFGIVVGLLSVITVALIGGFEPEDEILFNFIEEKTGIEVPFIHQFIPNNERK